MAEGVADTATIDLGEDLNCAICMQILFQPLTLLDCMHTFCGACLKDWFAHQAADARSIHPYTCPSCRDSVRTTKRYPFIMNMLEKHLKKNPDKVRSEEDKQEHTEKYNPGDNVLPKLRLRHPPPDPDDERVMGEVMALSLREAGITDNTLQPPAERRHGQGRESRSRNASRSPRRDPTEQPATTAPQATSPAQTRGTTDSNRRVEHQSSLRSLLSVSELDPQDMQDEILRQIEEEGLLNDVDLSNLDATQTEELSERIARAYQRRREQTTRRNRDAARARDAGGQRDRSGQGRTTPRTSSHSRAEEISERPTERRRTTDPRPPLSNPQLMDSVNQGQTRRRRSGSATSTRSNTARGDTAGTPSSQTLAPILPSAPLTAERRRRTSAERSATDPSRSTEHGRSSRAASGGSAPTSPRTEDFMLAPPRTHARQRSDSNPQRSPRLGSASTFPRMSQNHSTSSLPLGLGSTTSDQDNPTRSMSNVPPSQTTSNRPTSSSSARSRSTLYPEPSISCRKCGKGHQEYEVHYNCPKCSRDSKPYNICKSCFRRGEGCLHWFGFGSAAMREFEAWARPQDSNQEKPHVLTAQRLLRPTHQLVQSPTSERQHRQLSEEDPMKRLEKGVFCDLCSAFANSCYWKCDACNDGEWGFCNDCVNQGRHCTHPLLPLKAREDEHVVESTSQVDEHLSAPTQPDAEHRSSRPSTPKSASVINGPTVVPIANISFQPLTFHTMCDICTIPIPPSVTRYHCPQCNKGDYDICMNCYHGLVASGKVSSANGPQGWRKCPQGHRMVVIGFQDAGGGQRRVVARDLVGGSTFVDDSTSTAPGVRKWRWTGDNGQEQAADPEHRTRMGKSRTPPDGGIGLVFYGRWNYFPEEATEKDLCFPKGAEIREAEDINGDWLWGVYAGRTGLFPAAYVNFLRRITM